MRCTAWSILWIVPVLAGCQTPTLNVRRDRVQYTVSVVKLTTSERGRALLAESPHEHLQQVLKRRDTEVKEFPPVYLLPGETQEVNRLKRVDYQAPFTPDGKPQGVEHDTVGELVRATLELVPNAGPQVRIEVDDARLAGWRTLTHDKGEQKIPRIERAVVESTVQPPQGQWQLLDSLPAEPGSDRVCVYLARVDPPGRAVDSFATTAEEENFPAEPRRSEEKAGRVRLD